MSIGIFGYVLLVTALLAAGAAAIERAVEGHGATRHVWTASIALALVAAPAALGWRVYMQGHSLGGTSRVLSGALTPVASGAVGHGAASGWAALQQLLTDAWASPIPWNVAFGAWILASLALTGWICATALYWRRESRTWRPSTVDGFDVALTPSTGPAVLGVLSHRIVIPTWALALSPEKRTLVLAHESEHIRLRDPQRLALAATALILMPWNVVLWWCAARLRRAVEVDCDARVLLAYPDARLYGYVLLEVAARSRNVGSLAAPIVALLRRPSELEQRLRAITRTRSAGRHTAVVGALSAAVLAMAAFTTPVPLMRPVTALAPATAPSLPQLRRDFVVRPDTVPADDRKYDAKQVDIPATMLSDSPMPAYPAGARKQHLSGEVRVAFVVGVDGRVERGSERILKSNNALFSDAVTATLPRMRFKAAEYRGHRVRQIVEQPFTFVLASSK